MVNVGWLRVASGESQGTDLIPSSTYESKRTFVSVDVADEFVDLGSGQWLLAVVSGQQLVGGGRWGVRSWRWAVGGGWWLVRSLK